MWWRASILAYSARVRHGRASDTIIVGAGDAVPASAAQTFNRLCEMADGAAIQAERTRAGGSFIVRVTIRFSFPIAAAIAIERLTLDAMSHHVP